MFDAANVAPFRQAEMTAQIGDNHPPTFDDEIAAVLAARTLVVAWDRVKTAAHDPRVKRRHLCVLIELLDCMNASAGTAWPSREVLAQRCDLAVKVVENCLYDLRSLQYVTWDRRAGANGGRKLFHYTVLMSATAVLKAEVERQRSDLRAKAKSALNDLDAAIRNAKKLPPPLVEKKSKPVDGEIKTPTPLVEKSPPTPMEKVPPPSFGQEPTKEHTKEKRSEVLANKSSQPPAQPDLIVDEVKPAKRKPRATGKRPWEWVHESEKRELFERCQKYAEDRRWTAEFLAHRLQAFAAYQNSRRPVSADWWAELELWLGNPSFQPKAVRGNRRSSLADLMDDVPDDGGFN